MNGQVEDFGAKQFKALLDIYRLAKVVAPYATNGFIGGEDYGTGHALHANAVVSLVAAIERFEKAVPTFDIDRPANAATEKK